MAERERPIYSDVGPETHMTLFDGAQPTPEEKLVEIRKMFEKILERKPLSIVIYAEFEGGIVASAVGSYGTLASLMRLGKLQVEDMMARGLNSGENG